TTITGPGWTGTGGPWIKAEQSMQHLVPVSINTNGPRTFNQVLPIPQARISGYHRNQTEQMRKGLADFYEDVAVYAFPRCDPVIPDIDEKALFIRNPYTSMKGVRPYLPSPVSYPELDRSNVIDPNEIIDLTDRLQDDGRLEWDVPAGEWTILRMGRRSTGANTRPAPAAGLGFESNKFDKGALESHFEAYFDPLLEQIGPRPKNRTTGFTGLDADSWEMSSQNWTPGFRAEFTKRRGYDAWDYFPVYSGCVVGSLEISERFLWDVRMTCQALLLENHIGHMKKLCHERGLKLAIEPYDMTPTNDLDLGSFADIPMGEFWHNGFNSAWSCIEAASIGHIMGKPIVAAEAFTSSSTFWQKTPWTLKDQGDWAFAAGINRFVIVTFAHQPWLDRAPGMMFAGYGLHWERTQTFWPMLDAYHQYLARCSHLLQQGVTVSDNLYLTPEGAPHVFRAPDSALHDARGRLPDKKGYGFDACSPRMLINRARVINGKIVFNGGSSYSVMVLPECETMTPELLTKITELVEAGATVIGSPPVKSPSLSGYPECDDKVAELAQKLWGSLERPTKLTKRKSGRGAVYWGGVKSQGLYPEYDITAMVLKQVGVSEDFTSNGPVRYTHRATKQQEIYFVSNRSGEAIQADCTFRVGKGKPQLRDPVTGEMRSLPQYNVDDGLTTIPMEFNAHESFFVIFPCKDSKQA
ncbi:MAG: glycosyl hydrolase, partial [Planctomycetes bacterium]|nr:glycosyl hydrolase [Planctomycetota bacterium]